MDIGNVPDGGIVLDADQFIIARSGTARRIQGVRLVRTDTSGNALLSGDPIIAANRKLRVGNTPALGGDGGDTTFLYTGDDALIVRNAADSATLFRISSGGAGALTGTLNVTGALSQAGNQVWHAGNFNPGNYAALTGAIFTGPVRLPSAVVSDGNRSINLISADGAIYARGDAGGWDIGYRFGGPTNGNLGGFGALGSGDNLDFWYVGASLADPNNLRLTPAGGLTLGTRTIWHEGNFTPSAYAALTGAVFSGAISAPIIRGFDSGFNLASDGFGNPLLNMAGGAFYGFNRGGGYHDWFVSGATQMTLSATGLNVRGGITQAGNQVWHAGNFSPANYAQLASPVFTGTPTSTTPPQGSNDTRIATTSFVLSAIVASGYAALSGANFTGSLMQSGNQVWHAGNFTPATYAPLNNPVFTGVGITVGTFSAATPVVVPSCIMMDNTFRNSVGSPNNLKFQLYKIGTQSFGFGLNNIGYIEYHAGDTAVPGANSGHAFYANGLATVRISPAGLDVGTGALSQGGSQVWHAGNFTPVAYAPLASPALTGAPTAPTPAAGANDGRIATTAFVQAALTGGGSGYALLSGANFTGPLQQGGNQVWHSGNLTPATYAPLASPGFTGTPTAPTPATAANDTTLATTAFVKSVVGGYASLAGATFAGAFGRDANFTLDLVGGNPRVTFDGGDYLSFDRAANKLTMVIGGNAVASVDSTGTLRVSGNVIGATAP